MREAARSLDAGLSSAPFQIDAAIVSAAMHLRRASFEVQHAFGAIDYSEEHEAPQLFRRVQSDLARMGGQRRAAAVPERDLGPAAATLRQDLRVWLATNWTEADRAAERAKPFHLRGRDPAFSRKLGAAVWLSLAWPVEHGGKVASLLQQLAVVEELTLAGATDKCAACSARRTAAGRCLRARCS